MKSKTELPVSSVVPIIDDGIIASQSVGEGRMIPVVIMDCSEMVELRDLIYAHEEIMPGDVECSWATLLRDKSKVILLLKFTKPANLEVSLQFSIEKQSSIVDGILIANGLYLQPSESGLKVSEGLQKKKILVEIPEIGFSLKWEELYTEMLIKKFKKSGFSKSNATESAEKYKMKMRLLWSYQMKRK